MTDISIDDLIAGLGVDDSSGADKRDSTRNSSEKPADDRADSLDWIPAEESISDTDEDHPSTQVAEIAEDSENDIAEPENGVDESKTGSIEGPQDPESEPDASVAEESETPESDPDASAAEESETLESEPDASAAEKPEDGIDDHEIETAESDADAAESDMAKSDDAKKDADAARGDDIEKGVPENPVAYPGSVAVSETGKGGRTFKTVALVLIAVFAALLITILVFVFSTRGEESTEQEVAPSSWQVEDASSASSQATVSPVSTHRYAYVMEGPLGQYLNVSETSEFDSSGMISSIIMTVDVDESQEAQVLGFLESQFSDRIIESAVGDGVIVMRLDGSGLSMNAADYESAMLQDVIDFHKLQ